MDSRIEEILKEKVGDPYEEVPLMSRIEILLDRLSSSADSSAYAHSLELSINSQTYVLTATLKNTDGDTLGTPQTIDLPLETMVIGGSYDDNTKKVILTLKNGNTVEFSVADLVSGLQSEITSTNKLNSDLVDDASTTHKFVTAAEKTKIANALTSEEYNAGKTTPSGTTYTIGGTTYTVGDNAEVFNSYAYNKAIGNCSHAEGVGTTAIGNNSHAEGSGTTASGNNSHTEGLGTIASRGSSHAEGSGTTASGDNSHAEGGSTTASGSCSHAEGSSNTSASGNSSHAEGGATSASGDFSHAEGSATYAEAHSSHAEGSGTRAQASSSHAEGSGTYALGVGSHTEGLGTVAGSAYQHAQGKYNNNDQQSKYAFIIGNGTSTNARSNAFAVDWDGLIYVNNSATGVDVSDLLTEEEYNAGKQVTTNSKTGEIFNDYSRNAASGNYSHAEGYSTKAIGDNSHAEGASTTARGSCGHAEGSGCHASGNYSHAEGGDTVVIGHYSHVEGQGTRANSLCQHAQGKYNIEDSNNKYAFIIGNGTSTNARSNAFAVDWDGLIYVNNSATGVDVSNLATRLTAVETTIGNINAVLEEVL